MKSQKSILAGIAVVLCAAAFAQAANDPNNLKFVAQDNLSQFWTVEREGREITAGGPVKPGNVAILCITDAQIFPDFNRPDVIDSILANSQGKQLSKKQVELVRSGAFISQEGPFNKEVLNNYQFRIYGVSEDDTKRLTRAVILYLTERAEKTATPAEIALSEFQKQLAAYKMELSKRNQKLAELKKEQYGSYTTVEEALKAQSEFRKKQVELMVDLSGVEAKLQATQTAISKCAANQQTLRDKLEEMLNNQTIELAEVKARFHEINNGISIAYNAARNLDPSNTEAEARSFENQVIQIENCIEHLKANLGRPDMMPPVIFENKVTIYPLTVDK